jgi:hypothetical protein
MYPSGFLMCATIAAGLVAPGVGQAQSGPASLSFGGKAVAVDMTSCSPENSSNGKNLAIAAINMGSASAFTVQFASANPAGGTFITVADEDALGAGKVVVGLGGSIFGGTFVAKAGQSVTVVKAGAKYTASFSNLAVVDMMSKAASAKTAGGTISCQ